MARPSNATYALISTLSLCLRVRGGQDTFTLEKHIEASKEAMAEIGRPITKLTESCLNRHIAYLRLHHLITICHRDDGLKVLVLRPKLATAINNMSIITIDSVRMNKELIDLKVFGSKGPTKSELLHKLAQAEERLEAALAELHAMRDSRDTALVEVQSLQKRCEMLEERRDSIRTELELAGHLPNGPGDNEQEDPMDVDPPEEAEARPATPPPQPSSPSAPQPFLRIPTLPDSTTGPPVTPVRNPTLRMPSEHGLPTPPTTDEQPRRQPPLRLQQSLSYGSFHEQADLTPSAGTPGSSHAAPSEQHLPIPDAPTTSQPPIPNFLATPPPTGPRVTFDDFRRMIDMCEAQHTEEDRQRDARESKLRGEIATRDKENARLKDKIRRFKTEIVELKKKARGYRQREKGYQKREEDSKKREAVLMGKIKALEGDLSSHKALLDKNKEQIAQFEQELKECKAQFEEAQRSLKKTQDEHASLRKGIAQFSGGLDQLLGQHKDILQHQDSATPAGGDGDCGDEPAGPPR